MTPGAIVGVERGHASAEFLGVADICQERGGVGSGCQPGFRPRCQGCPRFWRPWSRGSPLRRIGVQRPGRVRDRPPPGVGGGCRSSRRRCLRRRGDFLALRASVRLPLVCERTERSAVFCSTATSVQFRLTSPLRRIRAGSGLPDRPVDALAQKVGVAVVACVFLDHVDEIQRTRPTSPPMSPARHRSSPTVGSNGPGRSQSTAVVGEALAELSGPHHRSPRRAPLSRRSGVDHLLAGEHPGEPVALHLAHVPDQPEEGEGRRRHRPEWPAARDRAPRTWPRRAARWNSTSRRASRVRLHLEGWVDLVSVRHGAIVAQRRARSSGTRSVRWGHGRGK